MMLPLTDLPRMLPIPEDPGTLMTLVGIAAIWVDLFLILNCSFDLSDLSIGAHHLAYQSRDEEDEDEEDENIENNSRAADVIALTSALG